MSLIWIVLAFIVGLLVASIVTDLRYLNRIDRLRRERDGWEETAARNQRNTDYYRGLVVKIGQTIGTAAYVQDDGGIADDVLCAKVPQLVATLLNKFDHLVILDHDPSPVDTLRPGWAIYRVTVQTPGGRSMQGTMQGDGHDLWALETFEHETA